MKEDIRKSEKHKFKIKIENKDLQIKGSTLFSAKIIPEGSQELDSQNIEQSTTTTIIEEPKEVQYFIILYFLGKD